MLRPLSWTLMPTMVMIHPSYTSRHALRKQAITHNIQGVLVGETWFVLLKIPSSDRLRRFPFNARSDPEVILHGDM